MAKRTRKTTPKQSCAPQLWALALISIVLYGATVTFEYAVDDKIYITGNAYTQKGLAGLPEIFGNELFTGYFGDARDRVSGGRYRPLTLASFAIEVAMFGNSPILPGIQHAVNVVLYALTLIMLFRLLRRSQTGWLSFPFITCLLFAVHPLHVEVVANIKSRDELLSFLLALVSVWLVHTRPNRTGTLLAGGVMFTALLAKETPVSMIIGGPLLLFAAGKLSAWRDAGRIAAPLVGATLLYISLRLAVLGLPAAPPSQELMNDPFLHATSIQHLSTVLYTWLLYLKLLLIPHPLTHDYYPFHIPILNPVDWRVVLALAIHVALALSAIILLRTRRHAQAAWIAFYAVTFALVSNLIFPIGSFMGERFLYIPSIAFAALAALGFLRLLQRANSRKLALVLLAACTLSFAARSIVRTFAWRNDFHLAMADRNVSQNSARIHMVAGASLVAAAEATQDTAARRAYLEDAHASFARSIELLPNYPPAWFGQATAYYADGQNAQAIRSFAECLRLHPGEKRATDNLLYIANQALETQDYHTYEQAYLVLGGHIDPQIAAWAHLRLGQQYATNLAKPEKARQHFEQALARQPDTLEILTEAAVMYVRQGQLDRASPLLQRAQKLAPQDTKISQQLKFLEERLPPAPH